MIRQISSEQRETYLQPRLLANKDNWDYYYKTWEDYIRSNHPQGPLTLWQQSVVQRRKISLDEAYDHYAEYSDLTWTLHAVFEWWNGEDKRPHVETFESAEVIQTSYKEE